MSVIPHRALLPLLALLLLSGCLSLQEREMNKQLEKTLHNYEMTLRWGYLQNLGDFLAPDVQQAAPLTAEELKNIRITGYEVMRTPVYFDSERVVQTVAIRYVFEDRQVEKQLLDQQIWSYDPEKERWNRANPIPSLK
jgi:hypothetical protein